MNTLNWSIENKAYDKGDIVVAEFKVSNYTDIASYQFGMKFDTNNLEFVGVEFPATNPLKLSTSYFSWNGKPGYKVGAGEIRHLFSNAKGKTLAKNTKVFSYVFRAKQAGELDDNLALATCCLSLPLKPLAYDSKLNLVNLSLGYTPIVVQPIFNETKLAVL